MPFATFPPATFLAAHATEGDVELTIRVATPADGEVWSRDWRLRLADGAHPGADWPWLEHLDRSLSSAEHLCLAVCRDEKLEAMSSLAIERDGSRLAAGKNTVYIEYVGVAPENLAEPMGTRAIRGLGGLLVAYTIRLSIDAGCEGRVGLHSKQNVEGFYRALGFTDCGYEETEDGRWLYFEMAADAAARALQDEHGD